MTGAAPPVHVDHGEFATDDPEAARDFIDRAYGASTRLRGAFPDRTLRHARVGAGGFSIDEAVLPGDIGFTCDPLPQLLVCTITSGAWEIDSREHGVDRLPTGEPLLIPAGTEYTADIHSTDMQVVSLEPHLLDEAAGTALDRHAEPLRFAALHPADASGSQLWRAGTGYVAAQLARAGDLPPLAVSGMARLLASVALTVFPNNARGSEPALADGRDATPDTAHRAVAFVESHADQDIGLTDIADAAGVTPRALQYAFRRTRGTTPLAYLRTVRLDLAHRDLLAAGPHSGATVTGIAGRWGFWHSGRFAARYRAVYGCSPGETLRRSRS